MKEEIKPIIPGFRTGKHLTEKDRPRKKDWKREYYKNKEPGRCNSETNTGSFYVSIFCELTNMSLTNYI